MNRETINKFYKIIMAIILTALVTSLLTSVIVYRYIKGNSEEDYFIIKTSDTKSNVAAIVDEYIDVLEEKYLGELVEQDLIDGAAAGLVAALGDPYSEYISKAEMDSYTSTVLGNYVGIGIYMTGNAEKGLIEVLETIQGSNAEKAGILAGDLIISADGVKYTDEQLSEASDAIKGKDGSSVTLEILRGTETLTFQVERGTVKLNHVTGEKLENNIGYIKFSTFDTDCAKEFKEVYEKLKSEGITSLIIDIRNNGGGLVSEALDIAEYIVDKGDITLITVNKENDERIEKSNTNPIIDMPIIVLVNKYSASASEILAGALQDNGKAKIVGETTYGKGVIQQLITMNSGSGLKLTVEEYCTPNRNKITGVGIAPDEIVKLPDTVTDITNVLKEEDTQLQRAIELLK